MKQKPETCSDLHKATGFWKDRGFVALDFKWSPPWKIQASKIKFKNMKVNYGLNFPICLKVLWTNTVCLSLWLWILLNPFYTGLSEKLRLSWNNKSARYLNPGAKEAHCLPGLCLAHLSAWAEAMSWFSSYAICPLPSESLLSRLSFQLSLMLSATNYLFS